LAGLTQARIYKKVKEANENLGKCLIAYYHLNKLNLYEY